MAVVGSPYLVIRSGDLVEGGPPWEMGAGPEPALLNEVIDEVAREGRSLDEEPSLDVRHEIRVDWRGTRAWIGKTREGAYVGTDREGWELALSALGSMFPEPSAPFDPSVLWVDSAPFDCLRDDD